jgi:DNA invertase Pin-like site-specific DNA recombinase
MLIGYARVSTRGQKALWQLDALREAGCKKIYATTVIGPGF